MKNKFAIILVFLILCITISVSAVDGILKNPYITNDIVTVNSKAYVYYAYTGEDASLFTYEWQSLSGEQDPYSASAAWTTLSGGENGEFTPTRDLKNTYIRAKVTTPSGTTTAYTPPRIVKKELSYAENLSSTNLKVTATCSAYFDNFKNPTTKVVPIAPETSVAVPYGIDRDNNFMNFFQSGSVTGVAPFYILDLVEPKTIDRIELWPRRKQVNGGAAVSNSALTQETRNFKIFAANQSDFSDGVELFGVGSEQYMYIGTFENRIFIPFTRDLKQNTNRSYRYIKILKTASTEPLSLDHMKIYSFVEVDIPPVAIDIKALSSFDGSTYSNEKITGDYQYNSADNKNEGQSIFKWYRSNSIAGPYEIINGANNIDYTPTHSDIGSYLKFCAAPVDERGMLGEEKSTESIRVADKLNISNPKITNFSNDEVMTEVNVANKGNQAETITLALTAKNPTSNIVERIATKTAIVDPNQTVVLTLDTPMSIVGLVGSIVSANVYRGMDDLTLLTNPNVIPQNPSTQQDGVGKLTFSAMKEVVDSTQKITVTAKMTPYNGENLTISILKPNQELNTISFEQLNDTNVSAYQMALESFSQSEVTYGVSFGENVPLGAYKIRVSATKAEKSILADDVLLYYTNEQQTKAILEIFNSQTVTPQQLQNEIITYSIDKPVLFGLPKNDTEIISDISTFLLAIRNERQSKQFSDMLDLQNTLQKAIVYTQLNNSKNENDAQALVDTIFSNDYQTDKTVVTVADTNKISSIFGVTFSNYKNNLSKKIFADFQSLKKGIEASVVIALVNSGTREQIADYLNRYKMILGFDYQILCSGINFDLVNRNLVNQGFMSEGEILDKINQTASSLKPSNPIVSSSGGGSVRTVDTNVKALVPISELEEVNSTFNDLQQVPWAVDSIEALAKLGVVNGVGNKEFRPNDLVTREQFIQILVKAFRLNAPIADKKFSDVKEDTWYYNAINVASSLGIVTGVSDGNFGIGEYVKREDVAVLINRVISSLDIEFENIMPDTEYRDNLEISDYAKDSVSKMKTSGIMNGAGGQLFLPKNYSTRAECAKIIYSILQQGSVAS